MKKMFTTALLFLSLAACMATGPQKTMNTLADALEKKDAALFLANVDSKQYAANEIRNRTAQSSSLSALDNMGRQLGLGGMEDLLGAVMDTEKEVRQTFTRGINTGELEAQCRSRTTADCPWVAAALRAAGIKQLSETAAVARVTTPAGITSWLALHKHGEAWLVVGKAPEEAQAARQAAAVEEKPAASAPAAPRTTPPATAPVPEKPAASTNI